MENEYVPYGSVNVIELAVEDFIVPLSVTDHNVLDGSPDSMNIIVYVAVVFETKMTV
jgi:hypothetical protein